MKSAHDRRIAEMFDRVSPRYDRLNRVLSFGKGVRLLSYGRSDLGLSDHMPVAATYAAEVEVFCGRKLQRALTLTNAEVETGEVVVVPDMEF